MTAEIVRDVTVGVGGTAIRSGIIGEVGIEGNPITENEVKSIRASGRASRATGAPVSFHRGGIGRERLEVVRILDEEGTDMSRVIFGHSDFISGDLELMLELLGHGVYIQFDLLGRVGVPLRFVPAVDDLGMFLTSAGTAAVAEAIPKLIEAGLLRPGPAVPSRVHQDAAKAVRWNGLLIHNGEVPPRNAVARGLGRAHTDDDGGEPKVYPDLRRTPRLGNCLTTR